MCMSVSAQLWPEQDMNTFLIVITILTGAVIGCKAGAGMSFDAGLHISNGNRDLSDMLEAKGKKSDNTAVYHSWYSLTAWFTKILTFLIILFLH